MNRCSVLRVQCLVADIRQQAHVPVVGWNDVMDTKVGAFPSIFSQLNNLIW